MSLGDNIVTDEDIGLLTSAGLNWRHDSVDQEIHRGGRWNHHFDFDNHSVEESGEHRDEAMNIFTGGISIGWRQQWQWWCDGDDMY